MPRLIEICVLCYGDHPDLAARCLLSIAKQCDATPGTVVRCIRVGLNAVSTQTRVMIECCVATIKCQNVVFYITEQNIGKYQMMRSMFADVTAPTVMWYDDDSYFSDEVAAAAWWSDMWAHFATPGTAMLGALYRFVCTAKQRCDLSRRAWFSLRPIHAEVRFIQGAWWVADLPTMRRFDYPFLELVHSHGDWTWGELCRQQGLRLASFRRGMCINADADGRESAAKRRGTFRRDWPFGDEIRQGVAEMPITVSVFRGDIE